MAMMILYSFSRAVGVGGGGHWTGWTGILDAFTLPRVYHHIIPSLT